MLSPADAALAARDRQVPGLGLVLDAAALTEWLRAHRVQVPGEQLIPRYVRYKPATSCVASYEWSGSAGPVTVTAKALRLPAADKLGKLLRFRCRETALGPAVTADVATGVGVSLFPWDPKLPGLRRLLDRGVHAILPHYAEPSCPPPRIELLSYKPERRAVLLVHAPRGPVVVRAYAATEFAAGAGRRAAGVETTARLARLHGAYPAHQLVVTEWVDGREGLEALWDTTLATEAGRALARLHATPSRVAWTRTPADERRTLVEAARGVADLAPGLAARLQHLGVALSDRLPPPTWSVIHGDFALRQVVVDAQGPVLTDLDELAWGDPSADIGALLADLDLLVVMKTVSSDVAGRAAEAFLSGYGSRSQSGWAVHRAAALIRTAASPFRARHPEWDRITTELVERAEELPWRRSHGVPSVGLPETQPGTYDEAMPWIEQALDPSVVTHHVRRMDWAGSSARVRTALVARHKPGRRCLIQYRVERSGGAPLDVLGKTRARGLDWRTARLVAALEAGAFGPSASDGIRVSRFLGTIEPLKLWLQAMEPGTPAAALAADGDLRVAERLSDVICKVQACGPTSQRTHDIVDELHTLELRLGRLADRRPRLAPRLASAREHAYRLASGIGRSALVPAHRDFHPDQVLIGAAGTFVLDFDLYAMAHPALDPANCIAHLLELGLRLHKWQVLAEIAGALGEAFAPRLTRDARAALEPLVTLTLLRLVEIADRMPERQPFVGPLLELCESRLGRRTNARAFAAGA